MWYDENGRLKPNEEDFVPNPKDKENVVRLIEFRGVEKGKKEVDYRYQLILKTGTT